MVMVTEIMLMHSRRRYQWNDTDGDGTVIIRMEHKAIGSLMTPIDGKILTVMVTQMKMIFPNDNTQWNDTDGDGYGDNLKR